LPPRRHGGVDPRAVQRLAAHPQGAVRGDIRLSVGGRQRAEAADLAYVERIAPGYDRGAREAFRRGEGGESNRILGAAGCGEDLAQRLAEVTGPLPEPLDEHRVGPVPC